MWRPSVQVVLVKQARVDLFGSVVSSGFASVPSSRRNAARISYHGVPRRRKYLRAGLEHIRSIFAPYISKLSIRWQTWMTAIHTVGCLLYDVISNLPNFGFFAYQTNERHLARPRGELKMNFDHAVIFRRATELSVTRHLLRNKHSVRPRAPRPVKAREQPGARQCCASLAPRRCVLRKPGNYDHNDHRRLCNGE